MKNRRILITGADGFIGKNLVVELKNRGFENLFLYDIQNTEEQLSEFCKTADIVFHLAGINRPKNNEEFYSGNTGFTKTLIDNLIACKNSAPIITTSSIQAELDNDYGKSKALAEQALYEYGEKNNVPIVIYRLVGVFGKWCRPSYNSVVATFCHNIARDLPIRIDNPDASVTLCYIDDVVNALISLAESESVVSSKKPLQINPVYNITLGELAELLTSFRESRKTAEAPKLDTELAAKLYGTYTGYLPSDGYSYTLKNNIDNRGHLAEFLKKDGFGQMFMSVTKPGITRGNHWHHTKTEKFFVLSGKAVIKIRPIHSNEVEIINVEGDIPTVVDIPTGCTHNITNTGESDLVTLFWSSEVFNPERPDTYYLEV